MTVKDKTSLSKRKLAEADAVVRRQEAEARQRKFFDEIVQDCGVCWDEAEHKRGFCQTPDGRDYREMYSRQKAELDGPKRPENAASEKQINFIRTLATERDVIKKGHTFEEWAKAIHLEAFDKKEASALIDSLLKRPAAPKPAQPAKATPATGLDLRVLASGYYAVPGGDTRLKLKIDVVEDGKWAGWVFVKDAAVYGAGKRYGRQRPDEGYQGEIQDALEAILKDPNAARAEYGKLTGRCGVCNRALEDETSVALGIGPVCREGMGL